MLKQRLSMNFLVRTLSTMKDNVETTPEYEFPGAQCVSKCAEPSPVVSRASVTGLSLLGSDQV
jgi:hypothetical protein